MSKVLDISFNEFLEDNVKELAQTKTWMKDRNMRLCESIKDLMEFVDKAIEKQLCCLDLETTGLSTRNDKDRKSVV